MTALTDGLATSSLPELQTLATNLDAPGAARFLALLRHRPHERPHRGLQQQGELVKKRAYGYRSFRN